MTDPELRNDAIRRIATAVAECNKVLAAFGLDAVGGYDGGGHIRLAAHVDDRDSDVIPGDVAVNAVDGQLAVSDTGYYG